MLKPDPIPPIPAETTRVIRAILPNGNAITRLRDEFGTIYTDKDFAKLYAKLGQPAIALWRLALVTVFEFLENFTDWQAAQAVLTKLEEEVRPQPRDHRPGLRLHRFERVPLTPNPGKC